MPGEESERGEIEFTSFDVVQRLKEKARLVDRRGYFFDPKCDGKNTGSYNDDGLYPGTEECEQDGLEAGMHEING